MKEMYIWVRDEYNVVDPPDSPDRIVRAYDKNTSELVGEWPEGGSFPQVIRDAYSLLS